jgi:hypothetical protein
MSHASKRKFNRLLAYMLTPFVDALTIVAYIFFVPMLAASFLKPSALNGVIILAGYACLVVGTRIIRMLGGALEGGANPKKASDLTGCGGFLGFTFGVFTATAAMMASGIVENDGFNTSLSGNGALSVALGWAFGLAMITLVVAYPFVLILPVKARIRASSPMVPLLRLLGVSLINTMVLITVAFWEGLFMGEEPAGMSLGFRIFALSAFYVMFLLFQAPPRILLFLLERNPYGLATFLISLAFYLWPLTA